VCVHPLANNRKPGRIAALRGLIQGAVRESGSGSPPQIHHHRFSGAQSAAASSRADRAVHRKQALANPRASFFCHFLYREVSELAKRSKRSSASATSPSYAPYLSPTQDAEH